MKILLICVFVVIYLVILNYELKSILFGLGYGAYAN
jgi:hypothetical protein